MTAIESSPAVERIKVKVTLIVTHNVTVEVSADTGHTLEQLKEKALKEFHSGGPLGGRSQRESDWRFQFANRANISVGREEVAIGDLRTVIVGRS